MSIVITTDQLNTLIYKYLCQCNLSHTAYALFNQANLSSSLNQYKYDIKAGQLISILQKGLIFNQIQSHVTINDYQECIQPFCLIKSHTCKITQKIKQENQHFMSELNQQIFASMRRTSSVHNTLINNREYQQIIYEQRLTNYFDRILLRIRGISSDMKFGGNSNILYAYDPTYSAITILKNNKQQGQLCTEGTLPCVVDNNLAQPLLIKLIDNILIRVYEGNVCQITKILDTEEEGKLEIKFQHVGIFVLPLSKICISVKMNPKINYILTFCDEDGYIILNTMNSMNIGSNNGIFQWKDACHYFTTQPKTNNIILKSLKNPQQHQIFNTYNNNVSQIAVAYSQIYFYAQCKSDNKIYVYTLEKQQPLYIFNFGSQKNVRNGEIDIQNRSMSQESDNNTNNQEILKQCFWISNNSSDDLLILTENSIKTFGIELNNYIKIIDIHNYDRNIDKAVLLKKEQNQAYVIFQGADNIIAYDIGLGKIERIQLEGTRDENQQFLYQLQDIDYIGLKINNNFYLAKDKDFESLFI